MASTSAMQAPSTTACGIHREIGGTDYARAVASATEALESPCFGMLTEAVVQATMKAKRGIDGRPDRLLGGGEPPPAHRALRVEPDIGRLMPCNVVVREESGYRPHAGCMDPVAVFRMTSNPDVVRVAHDIRGRPARVKAALPRSAEGAED